MAVHTKKVIISTEGYYYHWIHIHYTTRRQQSSVLSENEWHHCAHAQSAKSALLGWFRFIILVCGSAVVFLRICKRQCYWEESITFLRERKEHFLVLVTSKMRKMLPFFLNILSYPKKSWKWAPVTHKNFEAKYWIQMNLNEPKMYCKIAKNPINLAWNFVESF